MSETITLPRVRTKPLPRDEKKTEQPRHWHVVLLDDNDHSYEYVIKMMQELFAHEIGRAFKIAERVDAQGRAVVFTAHREYAELKQEQIHAYGADALVASSAGAMSAVLEPADFDGEDDDGRDA